MHDHLKQLELLVTIQADYLTSQHLKKCVTDVGLQSIVISMYVCLYVCLLAYLRNHVSKFRKFFLYTVPMVMARFSSDDNATCYILLVF